MSSTAVHALDTCIDPILRFLPAKYRLFLLSTCKQLSGHMGAAIKEMIPSIRIMRASGRIWCLHCLIAVHRDFVSFEYNYDYGDSGGCHRFKAIYANGTLPRYVVEIWNGMPIPDKQAFDGLSIEGDETFVEGIISGMLRIKYGNPMHVEYSQRVRLLSAEEDVDLDEEWKASYILYKFWPPCSRAGHHMEILKTIMRILEVPFDEEVDYQVSLPVEADEDYYDVIGDGDEVEEVYGTDYERARFRPSAVSEWGR